MVERTDAELVVLARSGDKDAFGQLIERYQSMAKRIAIGMVANENVAQDLVQEAMLQRKFPRTDELQKGEKLD